MRFVLCFTFRLVLFDIGQWDNGRIEGDGELVASPYSYNGTFNNETPVGPGR